MNGDELDDAPVLIDMEEVRNLEMSEQTQLEASDSHEPGREIEASLLSLLERCRTIEELGKLSNAVHRIHSFLDDELASRSCPDLSADEDMARKLQYELENEDIRLQNERQLENSRLFQDFLEQERTCQVCETRCDAAEIGRSVQQVDCGHHVCASCFKQFVDQREPSRQTDYVCPIEGCGELLHQMNVKGLLPAEDFDKYVSLQILDIDDGSATIAGKLVKCPMNCGWAVIMEPSHQDRQLPPHWNKMIGIDGKPLSEEAFRHRMTYRFRCRKCPDTDFCAECLATPYHNGFTCEGFVRYSRSRKCRYCDVQITKSVSRERMNDVSYLQRILRDRLYDVNQSSQTIASLQHLVQLTDPLSNLCEANECQQKARQGCCCILPCGHVCLGLRGERQCLGCLQCEEMQGAEEVKVAASDLCSICWVEELRCAPCIRLECGHVFHYSCVVSKIKNLWSGVRITFGFLECPLCKKHMKAKAIEDIIKPGLELYQAILTKAEQRLALEGGHKDAPELRAGGRYHKQPGEYAMHKFAYYLCYKCKQPYFGGHRSCEVAAGVGEERQFDEREKICGGCSAMGAAACPKHGTEAIEYKCKFCCSVASWFCWGTTHFCDSCHRKQGTAESMSRKAQKDLPTCTPKTCPLRIPHPKNGTEFVLGCQICRSESFC
uniref:RING-type domain-containing protein n=1 Tax=Guillardia theta TaxID=55529 RepID=A0A6U6BMR8_GUITH|mmetsp:Transcript_38767/g.122191  ORF Transcript_38767/g.122191 Transcript_38767/m.122191 type:complete len:664 (+) Transcript_38767:146-2137(+)